MLIHNPPAAPPPGVSFAGDLTNAIRAAKAAAGAKKYVNVLGASVGRQSGGGACSGLDGCSGELCHAVPV